MFRAGQDPLTFASNAHYKRYLRKLGRRQASVTQIYGKQKVAGKDIIHVPRSIYLRNNLQKIKWKEMSTHDGLRINREPTRNYDDSNDSE